MIVALTPLYRVALLVCSALDPVAPPCTIDTAYIVQVTEQTAVSRARCLQIGFAMLYDPRLDIYRETGDMLGVSCERLQ